MPVLSIKELPLKNSRVLLRVDFNVPLNRDGSIADNSRIKAALPTIEYILSNEAVLIIMSHLGRPTSSKDPKCSLKVCADELSRLLNKKVIFIDDCVGQEVEEKVRQCSFGTVVLLENLRFYQAEEKPSLDPSFAKNLAKLADYYVNDAFGTAHRAHSSTATIAQYFSSRAAIGFLMEKELFCLKSLLENPKRPFVALIGGAKISSKIGVLKKIAEKADKVFIGGAMAYTFFKLQGIEIGDSLWEEKNLRDAQAFLDICKNKGVEAKFPLDLVIATALDPRAESRVIKIEEGIPKGWQGVDIGPQTKKMWSTEFCAAQTIFWNGPVGVFEIPAFAKGTEFVAQVIAQLQGKVVTVVGGGDSLSAVTQLGLADQFSHLSTGGGAALEYIEKGSLPGIDALTTY